jgi:hypothetical protein
MRINIKVLQVLFLVLYPLSIVSCGGGGGSSGSTVVDSHNLVFNVTWKSSLAVPISNPQGIAIDNNDNIWVMNGIHNEINNTLICFNPNSGAILSSYDYIGLIESLGTGVYGIAWDGSSIWVSVAGNTNKIVQINPATGQIVRTISSPSFLGPTDLSWDGTNLWLSTGTGDIYYINPTSGGWNLFLNKTDRDTGIAYLNGNIWISNLFDNNIVVYNVSSKNIIDTINQIPLPASQTRRLTFHNSQLAVLTNGGIDFYDINTTP